MEGIRFYLWEKQKVEGKYGRIKIHGLFCLSNRTEFT